MTKGSDFILGSGFDGAYLSSKTASAGVTGASSCRLISDRISSSSKSATAGIAGGSNGKSSVAPLASVPSSKFASAGVTGCRARVSTFRVSSAPAADEPEFDVAFAVPASNTAATASTDILFRVILYGVFIVFMCLFILFFCAIDASFNVMLHPFNRLTIF